MSLIDGQTPTKYAKFVLNELIPRAKKLNIPLDDFLPPQLAALVFSLELKGLTFRTHTRDFLNYLVDKSKPPTEITNKIMNTIVMYYMVRTKPEDHTDLLQMMDEKELQ